MRTEETIIQDQNVSIGLESVPANVLQFDLNCRCTHYNHNSPINIFGLPGALILDKTLKELLIDDILKNRVSKALEEVRNTNVPMEIHSELMGPEAAVAIKSVLVPLFDASGLSGFSIITQAGGTFDEQGFGILETLHDFAAVLNDLGEVVYANKPFMGMAKESLQGTQIEEFFQEEDRMVLRAAILRAVNDRVSLTFDNHTVLAGTPRWYSNTLSPLKSFGNADKRILLQVREVSSIKNHNWNLRNENKFKRAALDNLEDGVIVVNIKGKIIFQNTQSMSILGNGLVNVQDINMTIKALFGSSETATVFRFDKFCLVDALKGDYPKTQEFQLRTDSDRQEQYFTFNAKPIMSREGEILGAVLVIRNTTEASKSQFNLEKAHANLDQFVRAVAHDLKSPVVNMQNLLRLIDETDDPVRAKLYLGKVEESASKLEELLSALMELVQAQQKNPTFETLNLKAITHSVLEDLSSEISDHQVRIDLSLDDAPEINYNKAYLSSILYNLISNAIKYRKEGRLPHIRVKSALQLNGDVELTVADNGIGIDLEYHGDDIFKPFTRLTTNRPGKGIGLNIVKNFVERNGGTVKVESSKGLGTTFKLNLRPISPNS